MSSTAPASAGIVRLVEHELGARIREIREGSRVLAADLADKVGLDPTIISKIENGRRGVKPAELAKIARALRVSPLALLEPDSLVAQLPIAARAAGASGVMGAAYDRLVTTAELHQVLADHHIYSSPKLAGVPSVQGLGWLAAAEALATWARNELQLDAVEGDERFSELAERIQTHLGVDVLVASHEGDPLSGAAITDRRFPLIFVNSAHALPRSLFTLAHELGHILAGHNGSSITLDRELSGSTTEERMANAFAASFLMPEDVVRNMVEEKGRSDVALINLAYTLGVSFESVVYRLHNLGFIDTAGRDQLRRVNWRQVLLHLSDEHMRGGLTRDQAAQLQARSLTAPAELPPALLVFRASEGFRKGAISAQAFADLVGEDPDGVLANYELDPDLKEARNLIAADYAPEASEADEDRFSGLPF